jgi:hypothetical protein
VTTVTGVIAVIAVIVVIAGIVSSGPVWAARTVAKGAVSPVTAVFAGRLRRDLHAGRDLRDSTLAWWARVQRWRRDGAVITVLAGIAVTLPVLHARTVGTGPPPAP